MSKQHADDIAVDKFAAVMKEKLAKKRKQGRSGWQECSEYRLSGMLVAHIDKGDPVDIANFCMMLWNNANGEDPTDVKDALRTALREQAADILRSAP